MTYRELLSDLRQLPPAFLDQPARVMLHYADDKPVELLPVVDLDTLASFEVEAPCGSESLVMLAPRLQVMQGVQTWMVTNPGPAKNA